jgi:heterotetrameric sarcosine oxidase beta subunit
MRYSVFSLARNALSGHRDWPQAWRSPDPKPAYDVIIVGGGGHGLATAYYLAKEHGITNVAVLEKGWLGGGNTGRNTTIVRSNYLLDENALFYEWSLKLWHGLSQDLNYNVMFSPRGVINLAHSDAQRDAFHRRGNAMRLNGIDSEWIDREELQRMIPLLDCSPKARYPIVGGLMQRRGGTARHDAVAWGFARGADSRGVDVIQNCEVTGFVIEQGRVTGVETTRGRIRAGKVGLAVAGHTGVLAAKAGFRLPIESHVLQAFVSEPLKPFLDTVVTFGAGHFYVSQSDKGELVMGGDLDFYNSYAQRGNLPIIEDAVRCGLAMFPSFARLRMLRHWGGVMDMSMDGSPIIGKSPVENLFLNTGWCYGGFKATPGSGWVFAHTIATGEPHPLNAALSLDRFAEGRALDEKGAGPAPWAH